MTCWQRLLNYRCVEIYSQPPINFEHVSFVEGSIVVPKDKLTIRLLSWPEISPFSKISIFGPMHSYMSFKFPNFHASIAKNCGPEVIKSKFSHFLNRLISKIINLTRVGNPCIFEVHFISSCEAISLDKRS